MPQLIWLYLTALLYDRTSVSCVALAEALATVSHDRLTRLLRGNWSGQTLLELAIRTLFVWERGYLIIDDTVLAAGCRHGYVGKPASGPVVGRRARGPGDRPIALTNRGGNLFSPGPRHRSSCGAVMGLSRLWQKQGKGAAAYELLAPTYGWFTESFDTPDLQDAKALLDALAGHG